MKVEHFGQVNMMYSCITVLRALALREGSQKIWKEYTRFESHLEERMPTPIYSKVNYRKSLIRSQPCIVLNPKIPRLVLEVFKKIIISIANFSISTSQ